MIDLLSSPYGESKLKSKSKRRVRRAGGTKIKGSVIGALRKIIGRAVKRWRWRRRKESFPGLIRVTVQRPCAAVGAQKRIGLRLSIR